MFIYKCINFNVFARMSIIIIREGGLFLKARNKFNFCKWSKIHGGLGGAKISSGRGGGGGQNN